MSIAPCKLLRNAALRLFSGALLFFSCSCKDPAGELPDRSASAPGAVKAKAARVSDVILITVDTLRADAVGFSGSKNVSTPHLDRLAARGVVFENARAANVVTLPSHANMLTGLYPHQHGIRDNTGFRLDARMPTLATILRGEGYATGAFVGAFPLDSRYGLDRGFDVYDDSYPPGSSSDDFEMRERSAPEVITAATQWYRENSSRKRFLWIHLYDPHAPYRAPAPFAERYAARPYLGEVAATDAALGPFLKIVEASPTPTLLVFTSDHGEALGDHGEQTHGLFAYEATLKVPLVLWSPGRIRSGRTKIAARHVDLLPTILEAIGGAALPAGLPGRSLLARMPDPPAYFEALSSSLNRGWAPLQGIVRNGFKYIDLPLPELYDLTRDPAEKENLFAARKDIAAELKRLLPAGSAGDAPRSFDSEEARRLLSLGYLSGAAARKESYGPEDDPKTLVSLDEKIHRVVDLFQRGEAANALGLAREIVRERPSMAVGYEFLAFLLQDQGRDAEAASVLQDAARRGLASEPMRVRLGLILSGVGRPADALAVLRPLAKSEDPDTQNGLGIALADSGRFEEALAVFSRILEKDPGNALALQNRGIALLKRDDVAGATAAFDRALAINGNLPRAWNARGVALARVGDASGAVESWRRAVELDPRQYDALFNIAVVAGKQGDLPSAREALERFIRTAPPALYGRDLAQARQMLQQIGGV